MNKTDGDGVAMRNLFYVGACAGLLGMCSISFAKRSEIVGIEDRAQGRSLVAANLGNDSLYTNPAASTFTRIYSVQGLFLAPKSFAVSIVDTKTSGIGGGLGYSRQKFNSGNVLQEAKLSLGSRVSRGVGLGLAGKLLWGTPESGPRSNLKDLDAGVLVNLGMIQLGGNLRNLLGGNGALGEDREFVLGGRINYKQLVFLSLASHSKMDDPNPYEYGIGAEYVSPHRFSIKGGFRYQPRSGSNYWTLGASINSPKIGLHYAVEIPQQDNEGIEHILGLSVFL